MSKVMFCAAATLLGGLLGASAPAEWRSDSSRYVRVTALFDGARFDGAQSADMALVYRPYQRGD